MNTLGFCEHFDGCHTSPTPVNNWASEHHRSCVTPHEHGQNGTVSRINQVLQEKAL